MISRASPPLAEFLQKGFLTRQFFPHRADILRKQYPDTLRVFERRGMTPSELLASQLCQINLYSGDLAGLPDRLFTDTAVNWHNQQLGEKGLIAAAGLCIQDSTLLVGSMQSDLCQQVFRHAELKRECKNQVYKRFGAWYKILFNAILDFAAERGIAVVYSPTAEEILGATRKRVQPDLFQRIYNFAGEFYCARRVTRQRAEYWEIPVAANADRVTRLMAVPPQQPSSHPWNASRKPICIFHDIEESVDVDVSAQECRDSLTAMLKIEKKCGVRATYNIVGSLFARKRDEIRAAGAHCLAFHSYDHNPESENQLARCREADLQVRGYRPPRSRITPELSDYALSYFNFEWLASGISSLAPNCPGIEFEWKPAGAVLNRNCCGLENGIVKIPILKDDYPLATGRLDYPEWRSRLLETGESTELLTFGLHDCYSSFWLPRYEELLNALAGLGSFITADELCDVTFRRLA